MTEKIYDAIVIGAGVSGLNCARLLESQKVNVLVLEASDRVGGRLLSGKSEQGHQVDLGGAYISPKQIYVHNLAQELGIKTYDVYDKGKTAFVGSNNKAIKNLPSGKLFENLDLLQAIVKFNQISQKIDENRPYESGYFKKLESVSLSTWLETNTVTQFARNFLKSMMEGGSCRNSDENSVFYLALRTKQSGGIVFAGGVKGGAQECKLVGGSAQLATLMANNLTDIKLSHVVSKIEQQEEDEVKVLCENGAEFRCSQVVVATPLSTNIEYIPQLPKDKKLLVDSILHGKVVKVIVYYEKPFWREKGYNGQTAFMNGEDFPVLSSVDDCSPTGEYYALVGFIHTASDVWMERPLEERKKAVAKQYALAFQSEEALDFIDYVEHDWRLEKYVPGCYSATLPVGTLKNAKLDTFLTSFGKVHFAGTETASRNAGYIDGAVEAGQRAAIDVLTCLEKEIELDDLATAETGVKYPKLDRFSSFLGKSYRNYLKMRRLVKD